MTIKLKVSPNVALFKAFFYWLFTRKKYLEADFKYYTVMRRPQLHMVKQFLTFPAKGLFSCLLNLTKPAALPTNIYLYASKSSKNPRSYKIFRSEAEVSGHMKKHLDNYKVSEDKVKFTSKKTGI